MAGPAAGPAAGQPQGPPQGQPPQQWQGQPQGQPPQQWQGQPQGQPPNMPPPPAGYGGYGGRPQVPAQVNTAAILLFVAVASAILGGLLFFAISSLGAIFVVSAVILLVVGGARDLGRCRAASAQAVGADGRDRACRGLRACSRCISLFKGGSTSIVGLIIDVVIIYMLMQKPVVEAFNQARR